ncbi:lauroyl-Kdo(2)-lipid IV(A) myristoyltransferase [Paraferrimonas sp. SM1919]|uniref:lauroyl-Kdo(2)-lipid IV(A) myristoyltransferase n=1 Tax=Paraferrimonas sp. SM1919 TaxID=2662263 RepID=UPI0013D43D7E|nr:lauroyl-Kdo(2)-lipid IV(A) myristoyltransferase [Paraferrimonas sp. SM1919]
MARAPKWFDTSFNIHLLHPKNWGTWLVIGLIAILAYVPVRFRDGLASALTPLVVKIAQRPLKVAKTNLSLCFPDKSTAEIDDLLNQNITMFLISVFGLGELLFRSKKRLKKRNIVLGQGHIDKVRAAGKPIIFIMPHVWALEYVGLRLNSDLPMVSMAKAHKNELFNWFNNRMRSRLGGRIYMREAGIRALLSELKQDNSFFYLPDEDLGPENSEFTPFFATEKATLPVVSRLAKMGNAAIIPIHVGYDRTRCRHVIEVQQPVQMAADISKYEEALTLNKMVENVILAHPEQYMWFLKIFRSQKEGKPSVYQ